MPNTSTLVISFVVHAPTLLLQVLLSLHPRHDTSRDISCVHANERWRQVGTRACRQMAGVGGLRARRACKKGWRVVRENSVRLRLALSVYFWLVQSPRLPPKFPEPAIEWNGRRCDNASADDAARVPRHCHHGVQCSEFRADRVCANGC